MDDTQDRKSGGKSADAFRTISEVSDEVGVPQHVLRFWETKFPQIRPLKRGGGRRYYRPEDIELLQNIRGLLYDDGYTIKGVQKLLGDGAAKPAGTAQRGAARNVTGNDAVSDEERNIKRIRPRDAVDDEPDRSDVSRGDVSRGEEEARDRAARTSREVVEDRVSLDALDDAVNLIEEPSAANVGAGAASGMDTVVFDPEDNSVVMSHDNQPASTIADWDRGMIMSVVESLETIRDRLRKSPSDR